MQSQNGRVFGAFLLGFIFGAGGLFLWLRKDYNKKVEEATAKKDKEIDKLKVEADKAKADLNDAIRDLEYGAYNAASAPYASDDIGTQENDENPIIGHSDASSEVFGISDKDFLYTKRGEHSKLELKYYAGDDVLCSPDGTVVENVILTLGPDWKQYLGKYDEDTAYIRNNRLGCDFEINVEHMNYSSEYGDDDS